MSVNITIQNAKKAYGDVVIIPDLSLDIEVGEFFTLLGPSGCGKTTLLRMIAGFNTIEGGDFYFNDKRINDLDPAKRNIGMVFQNYAIFPHFTVRKNIEFGLKNKKFPSQQISSIADEYMKLVQIEQFASRMPDKLSGGQQQRVALARALCINPDVLLMDEPLSNLDAKLRVEMRSVIKRIQNSVGITCVYVTHDQEEAMAISDRIAIMNEGIIQQIGKPKAIYQRPANMFVATFIGRTNILDGRLVIEERKAFLEVQGFKTTIDTVSKEYLRSQDVKISLRPEELLLQRDEHADGMKGVVADAIFLGLNTHYFVMLDSGLEVEIIQESTIEETLEKGSRISLGINTEKTNVFTEDGEHNILTGVLTGLPQGEET